MALDFLGVMIGADDTQYRETLARAQNAGTQFAGRLSQMIRSQTVGFAKLGLAIMGIGTLFGMVSSVVTGIVDLSNSMATAHDRAIIAAESHAEKIRDLRESYESVGRSIADFGGTGKGALISRFEELERVIDKTASSLRKIKAEASVAATAGSSWFGSFLRDLQSRPLETFFTPSAVGRESWQALSREIDKVYAAERGLLELEKERDALKIALELARSKEIQAFALQNELDLLRIRGDLMGEQVLLEGQLTTERRRRLEEIAGDDRALLEDLLRMENERHRANMRRIEEEDQARRRADAEREEREQRRADNLRFEADMIEEQYELERRRLLNDKEGADTLEKELEHKRKLRDINEREGIDDLQRRRLIELENRNYALRLEALGLESRKKTHAAFNTFDARLAFAGREARQAIGQVRQKDTGFKIMMTTEQILNEIQRMMRPDGIRLVLDLPN